MKNLLKNTLVGITLAAMATGAIAATKSDELAEKIGTELIQEYMSQASSGKEPSEAEFAQNFMKKMRSHLGEFKEAVTGDCVEIYGKEKNSACQCVTDKLDFEANFAVIEKQISGAKAESMEKEINALTKNEEEAYKACGLDINVSRAADEKAAAARKAAEKTEAAPAKAAEAQPAKK
jgi:hypothetical protein